jgi:hypothetical protein
MINLSSTSDVLRVTTTTTAAIQVHVSWVDLNTSTGTVTPGSLITAISTATTTTVCSAPASGVVRNIKFASFFNNDAAVSNNLQVEHFNGTTAAPFYNVTLIAKAALHYNDADGWYAISNTSAVVLFNGSTSTPAAGFATDTYLAGSAITMPTGAPKIGTIYRLRFAVSKTAAGTATPIISLRFGTAGTTADTAICAFTFSAGTAATDAGWFEVWGQFRAVGSGTTAVVQGSCQLTSQATTGISSLIKNVQTTSAGFNSTTANSIMGVSVNGGTAAVWTVTLVAAELVNFS